MIVVTPNSKNYGGVERTIQLLRERASGPVSVHELPNTLFPWRLSDIKRIGKFARSLRDHDTTPIFVRNFYNFLWGSVAAGLVRRRVQVRKQLSRVGRLRTIRTQAR